MMDFLRTWVRLVLLVATLIGSTSQAADPKVSFVLIASPGVERVDTATLKRLYTGRSIEVAGKPVSVANLPPGHPLRDAFLEQVVSEDNASYVAYWTVRRHVGKGTPPREFANSAQVIEWVQSTPSAIGYVAAGDLRPGMNVVYRSPTAP